MCEYQGRGYWGLYLETCYYTPLSSRGLWVPRRGQDINSQAPEAQG